MLVWCTSWLFKGLVLIFPNSTIIQNGKKFDIEVIAVDQLPKSQDEKVSLSLLYLSDFAVIGRPLGESESA